MSTPHYAPGTRMRAWQTPRARLRAWLVRSLVPIIPKITLALDPHDPTQGYHEARRTRGAPPSGRLAWQRTCPDGQRPPPCDRCGHFERRYWCLAAGLQPEQPEARFCAGCVVLV